MKLTVTAIGGVGRSAAAVARSVVDYLDGRRDDPAVGILGANGMVGYLADSKEGPGRWLGAGAAFHGLTGAVDRDAFQRVLEGRHPVTGARLISARGSSQRAHLAVGTAARLDPLGRPLYSAADAAALLGVPLREAVEMIVAGKLCGEVDERRVLRVVATGGGEAVTDAEITRHLESAARPVTAEQVLVDGPADELLSVRQVADLLRVSPRYVRRLCERSTRGGREGERAEARLASTRVRERGKWVYRIRRGDVAEFAAHREPPVARVGFDVTLTVEKSISVVAMLSSGSRQERFVRALDIANRTAIGHLDRVASVARRGGDVVHTEGLVTATFVHGTSRALDPHHHHHNVVANAVVDDLGAVRALDARALYRHAPEAAALATAALRWELRDLGLGWWCRGDGIWEIAGCDDTVIGEFSQRRQEIAEIREAVAEQLGRPLSDGEDRTIWAATRPDKTNVDGPMLLADWRERAAGVGFDIDDCFDRADRAVSFENLPEAHVRRLLDDLADPERGVCASRGDFDHADVVRAIADWSLPAGDDVAERKVVLPPGEIVRLADRFCGDERVIVIDPSCRGGTMQRRDGVTIDDGQGEVHYITAELLAVQVDTLQRWRNGRGVGAGVVAAERLDEALASHPWLSGEQIELVRPWCTSGDRAQAAIGRAGTGKTTTMRAAADAWHAAGYRVVGASVKGEAARQLAEDAGIESDTVALLLTHARHRDRVLDARTVLIVDEASTVGDRDLLALIRLAEDAGAAVRFIGDPAQHSAVPAGGCFEYLAGGGDVAQLSTIYRLQDAGERRRAELIRDARAVEAIRDMQASGQLILSPSEAETYAAVLARWYQARLDGAPHPIVHGRNLQRRELNELAQQILIGDGVVDPTRSLTRANGRMLCVGDEVMARHGDRRIYPAGTQEAWMRNGTTGRIVAVMHGISAEDDAIQIEAAGRKLTCPRSVFDDRRGGIELSYAVTSYAVQGSTRDLSTSVVSGTTTRKELYVDITRGRRENLVYGTSHSTPGDSDEHLPTIPHELVDELAVGLRRQTPAPVAVVDPEAAAVMRTRQGRSLRALLGLERQGNPGVKPAIERTAATIRQAAEHHPPATLRRILPEPTPPHLVQRYRSLAGYLAVLQASVNAPRRHARDLTEEAFGVRPAEPHAAEEWAQLVERARELAVDVVATRLARTPGPAVARQAWSDRYLSTQFDDGSLANLDDHTLSDRLAVCAEWRRRHSVDPDDPQLLGARPDGPDGDPWDLLMAAIAAPGRRGIDLAVS